MVTTNYLCEKTKPPAGQMADKGRCSIWHPESR
jgi:hypothetical protein